MDRQEALDGCPKLDCKLSRCAAVPSASPSLDSALVFKIALSGIRIVDHDGLHRAPQEGHLTKKCWPLVPHLRWEGVPKMGTADPRAAAHAFGCKSSRTKDAACQACHQLLRMVCSTFESCTCHPCVPDDSSAVEPQRAVFGCGDLDCCDCRAANAAETSN